MVRRLSAPTDARSATVLVGREREQTLLRSWLRDALAGCGGLVLVGGEAGIGKTRLIQDVAEHALAEGGLVLTGQCYPLTTGPPYSLWNDVLRSARDVQALPPILANLLELDEREPIRDHLELPRQLVAYFQALADRQPSVLMLEDVHWADPASLDLLRFLARELDHSRLLVVATYRDDELQRDDYLYHLLPHIVRESHALRTTLQRLGSESIREIGEHYYRLSPPDMARLTTYVDDLANGNPFYIHELFHKLEEERYLQRSLTGWVLAPLDTPLVPPLVQQIVDGRLARLRAPTRRFLETAAVIGQEVSLDLCHGISDLDESVFIDAVQEAIDFRLLVEPLQGHRLRFSHEIVREVLYRRVVLPERQAFHRRIAEALLEVPNVDTSLIAHHLAGADDPRSVEWMVRAARRANNVYAPRSAIEMATHALRLAEKFPVSVSPEAFAIRGQARSTVGDFEGARDDFERGLHLARAAGDDETEWQALLSLGILWAEREYDRAGKFFDRALKRARQTGNQTRVAQSLNRIGNWRLNVGRPADAMAYHQEALAIAQSAGDRQAVATTLDLLGMTQMIRGDLVQAADHYQRASELFTALGHRHSICSSLANLLNCTATLATDTNVPAMIDVADLMEPDGQIVRIAREIGWHAGEAYGLLIIGLCRGYRGDYEQALNTAHRGLAIAEEIEHRQWIALAHWRIGILYLDLLAADEARKHLQPGLALAREIGSTLHERAAVGLLASADVLAGELDHAEALLVGSGVLQDVFNATNQERFCWRALVELLLARRQHEQALHTIDHLIQATPNWTEDQGVAKLSMLRGDALLALGRLSEAEAELLSARRDALRTRARSLLWRIDSLLARLYQARGDSEGARRSLRTARETLEGIARTVPKGTLREQFLPRALAMLPALESAATGSARQPAVAGLTDRELEVLRLVAQGMTDAQIAEHLFLSLRTVNAHVRSIRGKLGVSSRSAATRFAVEHDLT